MEGATAADRSASPAPVPHFYGYTPAMGATERATVRATLRQLLRRARFEGWSLDDLEDEIDSLFREGVNVQPAPTPDQLPEPSRPMV